MEKEIPKLLAELIGIKARVALNAQADLQRIVNEIAAAMNIDPSEKWTLSPDFKKLIKVESSK